MTRFRVYTLAAALALGWVAAVGSAQNLIILDVEEGAEEIEFDDPLESSDPAISGRSIAELIKGKPLFAPIEGLPAEVWEDKTCSGCHQWDQETLCKQAQFYLSEAGRVGLSKVHPYGGGFKQAVRSWGAQGCSD